MTESTKSSQPVRKPAGRPSDYNESVALTICADIASGKSLREICRADGMPDKSTVLRWLLNKDSMYDLFRDQYAQARAIQREIWADETNDIADDGTNDWMERKNAEGQVIGWQLNGEHVQRSKLRVDTRKWFLARLEPKKYGDRITQEVTGADGAPLVPILNVTVAKE